MRDLLSRPDGMLFICARSPSAGSKNGEHVFQLHFRIVVQFHQNSSLSDNSLKRALTHRSSRDNLSGAHENIYPVTRRAEGEPREPHTPPAIKAHSNLNVSACFAEWKLCHFGFNLVDAGAIAAK
jgi:hypothetical protein